MSRGHPPGQPRRGHHRAEAIGKTTLARQFERRGLVPNYFTLDDAATRRAALDDPDGFALSLPRPATIDEIQRAPELMLAIKQRGSPRRRRRAALHRRRRG
ncbi:MAG: AAA family ATPase [Solirubrobacteraceae bacterium]